MKHLGPYTRYEEVEKVNPETNETYTVFRAVNPDVSFGNWDHEEDLINAEGPRHGDITIDPPLGRAWGKPQSGFREFSIGKGSRKER